MNAQRNYLLPSPTCGRGAGGEGGMYHRSTLIPDPSPANGRRERVVTAQRGFSIVELMVGLSIGLILTIAMITVYLAQIGSYKTGSSQSSIQSAENAISELVIPTVRSAGYCGCSSAALSQSNLTSGGAPPLGTMNTVQAMVRGYDAAAGTTINITQNNAANSTNANNWSSSLDTSLTGSVQALSDVIIVLGATPGTQSTTVTAAVQSTNTATLQSASGITVGQFGAISDCAKASIIQITNVAGNVITFASGSGALSNATNTLPVSYGAGAQFIGLVQTAFFVAYDPGGQSTLVRATLNSNNTWTIQSLVPGVQTMQVLYGIGTNQIVSQYVAASAVTDWSQVYAVRMAFLIEGQQGSQTKSGTQHTLMNTTVNVPADNRLRHVFEVMINLRNS